MHLHPGAVGITSALADSKIGSTTMYRNGSFFLAEEHSNELAFYVFNSSSPMLAVDVADEASDSTAYEYVKSSPRTFEAIPGNILAVFTGQGSIAAYQAADIGLWQRNSTGQWELKQNVTASLIEAFNPGIKLPLGLGAYSSFQFIQPVGDFFFLQVVAAGQFRLVDHSSHQMTDVIFTQNVKPR